ncbi:succinyl-CoA:acetate CoA-transferase [Melghiribacillus thermohalophilus]|uniref:Succinyl-CoA:acetate CoA-transferase n=1 Tax=Melghiribacillus thermohalophilus TaxID=1324956 RepID=A0A4R3N088_9BACI|nr:succinate CoA transferase [Melghiribacillus thermohalophilus]TCT20009.1 succinyl-CoA:acetate CoA-transferase [Melghiribacillus thermohalophilus]
MNKRLRYKPLEKRLMTAEDAAARIQNGMVVGVSGFARSGDTKAVLHALLELTKERKDFQFDLYTGASLGEIDGKLAEAGLLRRRLPFQLNHVMRNAINKREIKFTDLHLSDMPEHIRSGALPDVDLAIVEAVAITDDGYIVPSTSVGNNALFVERAKEVIVELNLAQPLELEGIHDIYAPEEQMRNPIGILKPDDRIGIPAIPVDPDKIIGVVLTDMGDTPSTIVKPDKETEQMAQQMMSFFQNEVDEGRLTKSLMPLQSGIGSVANAVLYGFLESDFHDLTLYSEVIQDAVFDLIDAGKINFASTSAIVLSRDYMDKVLNHIQDYKDKILIRPQEISNHPEVIRRLGVIAMNTAVEVDIYGNVNSTHLEGTKMMNGIGGSGDFARNARLAIFVTKSVKKNGDISSIVPFVSHVDHNEHDVDIIVTEQGVADLRGKSPIERAYEIIENCAHPDYKSLLWKYLDEAVERGGHTPHVLEKAFSFHERLAATGTMREKALVGGGVRTRLK